MDVGTFCAQSHVLVVAGKGGVGKTTMSAALATDGRRTRANRCSSWSSRASPASPAPSAGGRTWATRRSLLAPASPGRRTGSVRARRLTPDDALVEYLEDHGLRRVSKRLAHSGVLDVVSTAIPGIRDVLVLGKVKQLEREAVADLIVVDAPATGHAITFLTSASGLVERGPGRPAAHPGPGRRRPAQRPGPLPGHPGHAARGAAGLGDDRVGLHPGGQGGRAARAGHRQRLRPRARRAGTAGGRGGGGGRGDARTRAPGGARGGPAVPAGPPRRLRRADRAAAPRPAAPPPARPRRRRPTPSGRPRPSALADALADAVGALVAEGAG